MSLVTYSSSSSENECNDEPPLKKTMFISGRYLPSAAYLLRIQKSNKDEYEDNPEIHGGRIRSFKHERGNWATYIFIPINKYLLEDLQDTIRNNLSDVELKADIDLHLSLSRTVVLQYHLIDAFVKSIRNAIVSHMNVFSISLHRLKVYTNDEKTRTFIALEIDEVHYEKMKCLVSKVDDVMQEFKLPTFYKDASFHISFLWCLGDKLEILNTKLNKLINNLENCNETTELVINVNRIHCKSGNKEFTLNLM